MKIKSAEYLRSAVSVPDLIQDGRPQVALVGRSNVGKSTLLNRLVGRKALARISSTPGRTRAINYFEINRAFFLVDLPGYGYAKVSKSERQAWAELMERYLESVAGRALVIQLVDAKVGATALDQQATEYLKSLGISPIVAATKSDRIARGRRHGTAGSIARALAIDPEDVLPVSGTTGDGTKELWRRVDRYLEASSSENSKGVMND